MDQHSASVGAEEGRRSRRRLARRREARNRLRITLGLVTVTLFSSAAVAAGLILEDSRPEAVTVAVSSSDGTLDIAFAGDTLMGEAAQTLLDTHGYLWPMAGVQHLLAADYSIVNAEGPITERVEEWDAGETWSYNSYPPAAYALAGTGVRALGLANNHAFDRGPGGLTDTMTHAGVAGLPTFGAGQDLAEAERPLLIHSDAGTVGIVALADAGAKVAAGEGRPGLARLTPASIKRGFARARAAGADWVVAYVHWGENYAAIEGQQRESALEFAGAGYDLVIGHGPHVLQPIEIIGSMPVVYSLGNFVFTTPGRFTDQAPGYGAVVKAQFGPQGMIGLELRCLLTDNETVDFQPRACDAPTAGQLLPRLNAGIVVQGDVGRLDLRPNTAGE